MRVRHTIESGIDGTLGVCSLAFRTNIEKVYTSYVKTPPGKTCKRDICIILYTRCTQLSLAVDHLRLARLSHVLVRFHDECRQS